MTAEQGTHSTMSLGVNLCSFNRTIAFRFTLGPWTVLTQVLGHLDRIGDGFHHGVDQTQSGIG